MGSKSRALTFLMATGYEQVRSVAAYLGGDSDDAEKVKLDLPETGVCRVNIKSSFKCLRHPVEIDNLLLSCSLKCN